MAPARSAETTITVPAQQVYEARIRVAGRGLPGGGAAFSPDGRRVAFSFSSSTRTYDVHVWDLASGEQAEGDVKTEAPAKALFRATRIAPDHPGLAGRDL